MKREQAELLLTPPDQEALIVEIGKIRISECDTAHSANTLYNFRRFLITNLKRDENFVLSEVQE